MEMNEVSHKKVIKAFVSVIFDYFEDKLYDKDLEIQENKQTIIELKKHIIEQAKERQAIEQELMDYKHRYMSMVAKSKKKK